MIYINNLRYAIKYFSFYQFADDSDPIIDKNTVKTVNKQNNQDFESLTYWLNARKVYLNISKTEVVLLKSGRKQAVGPI